jgi:16S rRNA (cytidine1402-2'-O)-methyltransferase
MADSSPNPSLQAQAGHLYVVATPIGNLADVSERVRAILAQVDIIACEDTRTTGLLLSRLQIAAQSLVPYHDHNEIAAAEQLLGQLQAGRSVAVVCDAGTPGLSDPGFRIVRACRKAAVPVIPVPGPSALTAVLSASGLPSNRVYFVGFLPPKSAARTTFFTAHRDFPATLALYESCHRIDKAGNEIVEVLGPDRVICVAKEITKLHENFWVGPAAEVRDALAKASHKGEFVLLIAPAGFEL